MESKVSVIVPIYNVEKLLDRCILSILNQTYVNIEVLLVNDGSTDGSLQICKQYSQDNRVIIIDKPNGGLSDARNAGLKVARGDYCAFIDSDDFIKETMLETMMKQIKKENADICVCDMQYLYDDGREDFASGGTFTSTNVVDTPELVSVNNSACNKMFKTTMFQDVLFPVGKFYEDLATIPILLYKARKVCKVDEAFYIYYQRSGSIAHTANKKIFDIYDAIAGCIHYVENHGNEPKVLKALKKLYVLHGLDITTIRIKDFDDKKLIPEYMEENMKCLNKHYPNYKDDDLFKTYSWKKKLIFYLLEKGKINWVMKLYGK